MKFMITKRKQLKNIIWLSELNWDDYIEKKKRNISVKGSK